MAEHPGAIAAIEGYVTDFATALTKWSKPSWWVVCVLLAIVMMLNALRPEATLVSKFLKGRKVLSRVAATLATLACFSFFASDTFRPHITATHEKIRARLIVLEKEKAAAKTRRAVLNAFSTATEELDNRQRAYLTATFQAINAISLQPLAAKAVALKLADSHWNAAGAPPADVGVPNSVSKPGQPGPDTIQPISYSTLLKHEKELASEHAAITELKKGSKEIFSKTVGAATDPLRDIAFAYVGKLFGLEDNELFHQAQRYVDAVTDDYFDKIKDKAVARVRTIWGELGEKPADEVLSVAIKTRNAEANEAIRFADIARLEAASARAEKTSDEERISLATKSEADAQLASKHADIANNLSPELWVPLALEIHRKKVELLNANSPFAKAGAGLVIADSDVILKDSTTAVQSVNDAVKAANETAAAVRAANDAAAAARAANDAAAAVRAAAAARAAKDTEDIVQFWKFIK